MPGKKAALVHVLAIYSGVPLALGRGITCCAVDRHGLVDVDCDKVLVAVRDPRELGQLRRLLHQTQHGVDVAAPLVLCQVAPVDGLFSTCALASRKIYRGSAIPLPPDLKLSLGACFGFGNGGIDTRPALLLQIEHHVSGDELTQQKKPGRCKQRKLREADHGDDVGLAAVTPSSGEKADKKKK